MNDQQFEDIIQARVKKCLDMLGMKAKEYARGDRLHNFHHAGALLRCSPEKALLGFLAKHLVSIIDMIEANDMGAATPMAIWDEKIGDAINYLLLLDACLKREETK